MATATYLVIAREFLKRRLVHSSRLKVFLFVSLFAVCICIFWTDFKLPIEGRMDFLWKSRRSIPEVLPSCVIPLTPIFPAYFKKHWHPRGSHQDCKYERIFMELQDERELVLKDNAVEPCCIHQVFRGVNDTTYNITECEPLDDGISLDNKEAIFVRCIDGSMNAEAAIPIKDGVQEKLHYWESIPHADRPYSVLMFGFDSVSRSHAYRSIPKSLEIMKTMGFVDFQGYHSVAPSTLTNMMAFLMGLTRPEVRGSCAKDWEMPFDECPFIWKGFSDANYLTLYLEDGNQTFNWGGQSGFTQAPTDFYLHHMFLALAELRQDQVKKLNFDPRKRNVSMDCISSESVPEFMLRYTERFTKKFSQFPFFAFSWFGYPFHEDIYSLAAIDNKLAKFFEKLNASQELLDRTLIIFLSDHGDRMSFFNSMSVESHIERGLPPLFIKLPDELKRNQPEIFQALASNSHHLTTPFDVHHTLLHLLSLGSKLDPEDREIFHPHLRDRTSLLTLVGGNRNCSMTNIPATNCLCHVPYNPEDKSSSSDTTFKLTNNFKSQALKFVIQQLNSKVMKSKYQGKCERWYTKNIKDVIYARKMGKVEDSVEFIFAFKAWPEEAKFEARMLVTLKPKLVFKQLIGFARINRYGDQSWCVETNSDSDKEMKELCICKDNFN